MSDYDGLVSEFGNRLGDLRGAAKAMDLVADKSPDFGRAFIWPSPGGE